MSSAPPGPATSRRDFLAATTLGAATFAGAPFVAGCGKKAKSGGAASNAKQTAEVLPVRRPLKLLNPDLPGAGPIPDGYLKYPSTLVRAVKNKPGTSKQPITAMMAGWGPTPPGLGRNAYLEAVNAALGVPIDPSVQDGMTYAQKLSAILGARDVPELLSAPRWEIDKIPRFAQAVKALFEDLTDHLKGTAVEAYPMLATLPTESWQYAVWGGRLAAVPFPSNGPFPWAMFYRKDLTDKLGLAPPKTMDELVEFGKKATKSDKGVWAF
ncbi:MAG TPA: extracellular solute-binding protein, partial [Polyangiaceae bacterium]|nr:extracellular solute-binding protein [Polyangiaceae bacterium]